MKKIVATAELKGIEARSGSNEIVLTYDKLESKVNVKMIEHDIFRIRFSIGEGNKNNDKDDGYSGAVSKKSTAIDKGHRDNAYASASGESNSGKGDDKSLNNIMISNAVHNDTYMVIGPSNEEERHSRSKDDYSMFSNPLPREYYSSSSSFFVPSSNGNEKMQQSLLLKSNTVTLYVTKTGSLQWQRNDTGEIFAKDSDIQAYQFEYIVNDESNQHESDKQQIAYVNKLQHRMERVLGERYYGMGESSGNLNKYGRRIQVDARDALSYSAETSDPLYKHTPLIIVLSNANTAYALIYDTMARGVFDLGNEISAFRGFYRYFNVENQSSLDYYMIYGPTLPDLFQRILYLIGKPALPPSWALGYLGSAMAYTDMKNAQELLLNFKKDCLKHRIPCDGFHLSSGYCMDDLGRRMVFKWNTSRVPNPKKLFDDFADANINLICNIKPWLLLDHPDYKYMLSEGGYFTTSEGKDVSVGYFWKGGAGTYAKGSYLDFSNKKASDWWEKNIKEELLKYGAKSMWNDNNEYEEDDDSSSCSFGPIGVIGRALQPLMMGMSSFKALIDFDPKSRPLVVSRSGGLGTHRYCAQTWSGDNTASWHTMKWNIPMSLSLSMCGWIGCGADVGGFVGMKPTPELFIRWVQIGIFLPRFSIHSSSWKVAPQTTKKNSSANDGNNASSTTAATIAGDSSESKKAKIEIAEDFVNLSGTNEPWMFGSPVTDVIRALIRFRCRMRCLLQSLHLEAAMTGLPVIRALVVHYQFDKNTRSRDESFEFLLGRNLLVAGVFNPFYIDEVPNCSPYVNDDITTPKEIETMINNDQSIQVYFPGDSTNDSWLDLHNHNVYAGGSTQAINVPISGRKFGLPLFLRLGSGFVLNGNEFDGNNLSQKSTKQVREVFVAPNESGEAICEWFEESGLSRYCAIDSMERSKVVIHVTYNNNKNAYEVTGKRTKCNEGVIQFDSVQLNILTKQNHEIIKFVVMLNVD